MNAITNFRLCSLTNEELMTKVDEKTDKMFAENQLPAPALTFPAMPNENYDLLIGELLLRFVELQNFIANSLNIVSQN